MGKITYINIKHGHNVVETIDEVAQDDYSSYREYKDAVAETLAEYRLAFQGHPVPYTSRRCDNDWKQTH